MREIKFRGVDIETKEWVCGYLWAGRENQPIGFYPVKYYIRVQINGDWGMQNHIDYRVYDASIGQYTGLKDNNKDDIYEGDIVHYTSGEYYMGAWEFSGTVTIQNYIADTYDLFHAENLTIIGTTFKIPELLKENKDV